MIRALPLFFVVLWSTGFIGAKHAAPYAEPLTTLSIRFLLVVLIFLVWVSLVRAPWPSRNMALQCFGIGVLLHGIYLGGVFIAIDRGLPSGPSAMIVSVQPVLTALLAVPFAGERLRGHQWAGIFGGFVGVTLVLLPKLSGVDAWPLAAVLFNTVALMGITLASPWQKSLGAGVDPRTGGALQYLGGAFIVLPAALVFETQTIEWTGEFIFALFWLVFVLSLGAVSLFMYLIERGALVATVAYMYLVPTSTAIIAYFLFEERLLPIQLIGFVVATIGVGLVTWRPTPPKGA